MLTKFVSLTSELSADARLAVGPSPTSHLRPEVQDGASDSSERTAGVPDASVKRERSAGGARSTMLCAAAGSASGARGGAAVAVMSNRREEPAPY